MDASKNLDAATLRHSLQDLLELDPPKEERLHAELQRRKKSDPGAPLYSSVLHILTHLDFSESEAERHWKKIRAHREALKPRLRRDPGLRVALLDYFLNLNHELENPKIIEISIFEQTERSAITDGLTGLFNHRHFAQILKQELSRARRHRTRVSLALFDLDDFKKVNDTRGHPVGDKVLVRAAAVLKDGVRDIDTAARYGGEEFAVILPETGRTGAYVVADRVRQQIERHFRRARGLPGMTVSGGVASFPDDAGSAADLVKKADRGLYRSKAAGKNRITLAKGERRRHRREEPTTPVKVAASGKRVALTRTKNVSAGGVLVSLKQPVEVGSLVSVVLRDGKAPPVDLRGQVVRVSPAETRGAFDVGVRFVGKGRARVATQASSRPKSRRRA
jgi:diguanylate cyclase (GGDEF)-like protein